MSSAKQCLACYAHKMWIWCLVLVGVLAILQLRQLESLGDVYDVNHDDIRDFPIQSDSVVSNATFFHAADGRNESVSHPFRLRLHTEQPRSEPSKPKPESHSQQNTMLESESKSWSEPISPAQQKSQSKPDAEPMIVAPLQQQSPSQPVGIQEAHDVETFETVLEQSSKSQKSPDQLDVEKKSPSLQEEQADTYRESPKESRSGSLSQPTQASRGKHQSKSAAPPVAPLESYYYARDPVIPQSVYDPVSSKPLAVVWIGTETTANQTYDWILDAVARSRYLFHFKSIIYDEAHSSVTFSNVTKHSDTPIVYIVDWASLGRDCSVLERLFHDAGSPEDLSFLFYVDTSASNAVRACPKMEDLFEKSRIRIAKRAIVTDRYWNATRGWVETGSILDNQGSELSGGSILFSPYVLEESFVDELKLAVGGTPTIKSTVYEQRRTTSASHFWRKGDYSHYGFLRHEVGNIITHYSSRTLNKIRGDENAIEKGETQPQYIAAMLKSKIVVVAQKDEWEDHHRLFESMASGALVFTDAILAVPHGLRNRTNIVIYDGHSSLKRQLRYYLDPKHNKERLDIARRGWKYVMGKQRSWHRLECLLFGMAKTSTNKPEDSAPLRTVN